MSQLGYGVLVDNTLLPLWDQKELQRIKTADGRTFEQIASEVQTAAVAVAAELLADPLYGNLFSLQTGADVEYPIGQNNDGIQEIGEFETPLPYKGKTTGHSIGLKNYARALGWSMLALRDRTPARLNADIRSVVEDIRNHYRRRILTRFFTMEAWATGATAGANVPLADGGVSDSTYVPPQATDGATFLYTHDHFSRIAALDQAAFETALLNLVEHGYVGPYDVIAAEADAATWTALTGWKPPLWTGIAYQASATERFVDAEPVYRYHGAVETDYGIARVWLNGRVPTAYFGIFKAFGANNPMNPVRMRYDERYGFGYRLVPGNWVKMPMELAVLWSEYQVGIGEDRTNGVCVRIAASGDYVTPTIT